MKFGHYRHIPSLREYVMVAQDRMMRRAVHPPGRRMAPHRTAPSRIRSCGSSRSTAPCPLDRIYAKVKFEAAGARRIARTAARADRAPTVRALIPARARRPTSPAALTVKPSLCRLEVAELGGLDRSATRTCCGPASRRRSARGRETDFALAPFDLAGKFRRRRSGFRLQSVTWILPALSREAEALRPGISC